MVVYSGAWSALRLQKYQPPAATAATAMSTMRFFQALERADVAMRRKVRNVDGRPGKASHTRGGEAGRRPHGSGLRRAHPVGEGNRPRHLPVPAVRIPGYLNP